MVLARNYKFRFQERITSKRAPQEEQNDANFSSIAPFSKEVWVHKEFEKNALLQCIIVQGFGFQPKTEQIDFGKQVHHSSRGAE